MEPALFEIKVLQYYCNTSRFNINGMEANHEDFGYLSDEEPEERFDSYSCGRRVFTPTPVSDAILFAYCITKKEAELIQNELVKLLSFGNCHYCS